MKTLPEVLAVYALHNNGDKKLTEENFARDMGVAYISIDDVLWAEVLKLSPARARLPAGPSTGGDNIGGVK